MTTETDILEPGGAQALDRHSPGLADGLDRAYRRAQRILLPGGQVHTGAALLGHVLGTLRLDAQHVRDASAPGPVAQPADRLAGELALLEERVRAADLAVLREQLHDRKDHYPRVPLRLAAASEVRSHGPRPISPPMAAPLLLAAGINQ